MTVKISKRFVDSAAPEAKDSFHWDSEAKGFGLKVTPTGRKVYLVQYRLPGTPTRRHTIGKHGSPWTPDMARIEAMLVLGAVAAGKDPSEERRAARNDITMAELCDLYEREGGRTKKASTRDTETSLIQAHIKPLIGRVKVRAVTKANVNKLMRDVADGKTANKRKTKPRGRSIVRGGPSAANRTFGLLSPMLEFAVEQGLRPDNPSRGVKKYKEGRPARFLSNDEIARLGGTLRTAEADGVNPFAIAAIRLLLLTGCRKNEILSLRWDEVDIGSGFLRLGDSKTGAKAVPIGAPALSLLSKLPHIENNPFVIIGDKPDGHLVGLQKIWASIRSEAKLSDVRLHDLRHSFASVGARSGESLLVIGKVLGHASTAATSRYAHLSDDPVRGAAEGMSKRVFDALSEESIVG